MLTTYCKRQTTQATDSSGPAGPSLDAFTHWREQRGYRHESIRRRLHGAAQCITWAQTSGCDLPSLAPAPLEHLRCHLSKQSQRGLSQGQHSVRWLGAQRFFACLQPQQILASADTATEAMSPELLREFEPWMQRHRGVQCATLLPYRPHVMALLT
jgi:hypothetical protein